MTSSLLLLLLVWEINGQPHSKLLFFCEIKVVERKNQLCLAHRMFVYFSQIYSLNMTKRQIQPTSATYGRHGTFLLTKNCVFSIEILSNVSFSSENITLLYLILGDTRVIIELWVYMYFECVIRASKWAIFELDSQQVKDFVWYLYVE